jgi:hypothetical protein
MFPKKLVLAITSHGGIICDINEEDKMSFNSKIETFRIPEGITIRKVSMSVPGNVNFLDPKQVFESIRMIKREKKNILTSKKPSTVLTAVSNVTRGIQKFDANEISILKTEIHNRLNTKNRQYDDENQDESYERLQMLRNYIHSFEKGHQIYILKPGDEIINKKYERKNKESTQYDWAMPILNLPDGEPDLLKIMKVQTRYGTTMTTTEDIFNYLKDNGVEELTIFDFSCSIFYTSEDLTERNIRSVRRGNTLPYGGKQRKYKTKKNKKKKDKKENRERKKTTKSHKRKRY